MDTTEIIDVSPGHNGMFACQTQAAKSPADPAEVG